MKRLLMAAVVVAIAASLMSTPVLAKGDNPANNRSGGVGKSNNAFLYLYEKDPVSWNISWGEDMALGKMKFNLEGQTFDFLFNGHGLEAATNYSLIYYPEPQTTWPWPVEVLATGMSNDEGDIHLDGSVELPDGLSDAKIWLVLDGDIVGGELSGWNPSEYLFEHNLITYTYTGD